MKNLIKTIAILVVVCSTLFTAYMVNASEVPPTDKSGLYAWLKAGSYKAWAHESTPHTSVGPHPTKVVTYINKSLDQSLSKKATTHPKGSAAVKELLNGKGELSGWAVSIKTDANSNSGKGWFWYEMLGTRPNSNVVASDNGVPLCFGCHTPGSDYVLTPYPLK